MFFSRGANYVEPLLQKMPMLSVIKVLTMSIKRRFHMRLAMRCVAGECQRVPESPASTFTRHATQRIAQWYINDITLYCTDYTEASNKSLVMILKRKSYLHHCQYPTPHQMHEMLPIPTDDPVA